MKSFIATCALVSFAQAVQVEQTAIKDFASWMATYNVSYATTTEKSTRQTNWNNNFKVIDSLNKTKGHTFTVGPNIMADRTAAEVTKIVGAVKAANKFKPQSKPPTTVQGATGTCNCGTTCGICACNEWGLTQQGVASKLDWTSTTDNERGLKAFNAIQNQGNVCSAGWAFADAALMEAFDYIANPSRPLQKFSEQQLIDCNPLNYNCTTGKEDELFTSWLIPSKVQLNLAANYPYTGVKAACKTTVAKTNSKVDAATFYFATDKPGLLVNALRNGPLNAWVNGDSDIFKFYTGGIINSSCCLGTTLKLNHVVNIVGYNVDAAGNSSWIIRNSFGTGWGVNGYGYIKIASQGEGICGELNTAYQIAMDIY